MVSQGLQHPAMYMTQTEIISAEELKSFESIALPWNHSAMPFGGRLHTLSSFLD